MDVLEIGREIQDLRRRIARVEADSHQPRERAQAHLIGTVDASAAGFAIS